MTSATPVSSKQSLRLLNVVSSMNPASGGISESIVRLSKALESLGHHVETVSVDDPKSAWQKELPITFHLKGPPSGFLEHSEDFNQWLRENSGRFDAILSHGIWRDSSRATRRAAQAAKRPYFVFPHGMLDPWFKRYYPVKHLKKYLFWWAFEYAVLRDAQAVLFTCEEEKNLACESFRPYRCVERVVPLGTSEPPTNIDDQRAASAKTFSALQSKKVILFLGRLHVKKGCDLLLRAFLDLLKSRPPEVWRDLHVMLTGPCAQPEYLKALQEIAAECEAISPGCVSFPGMISGDLKWGALRGAEVFVLPSHQENFGVAVVEAMACGTPVLITHTVNIWREVESTGAGFVEDDTVEGCSRLLSRWLELSPEARKEMGAKAAMSFRENFEISRTAASLVETISSFLPEVGKDDRTLRTTA